MRFRWNCGWWLVLGAVLCVSARLAFPVQAADQSKTAEKADPFAVPEGTPEELLKYLEGLKDQRPKSMDAEGVREFRAKLGQAVLTAAERILAAKSTDEQASQAVQAKVVALSILDRVGRKDAAKQLEAFPAELQKAGRSKELVREARATVLTVRLSSPERMEPTELEQLIGDVKRLLPEGSVGPGEARLAMTAARAAERSGLTELAADAYRTLGELVSASKDPRLASLGAKMIGSARRLTIVGKPMEIEGKTHDGKPFDWASYQGKVVLVDFWATWCGPCLEEMEGIRENYDAYHDQGFEVLGISIDEDRSELAAFLKQKRLPWTVLVTEDPKEGEPDRSMATRYGIFGIPALFLVGRDGKVVSTKVRGEQLGEQLAKLLGPPKGKKERKEKPKDEPSR